MNILFVLPAFYNGGTSTALRCLLPLLKQHNYDVSVFGITNDGPNKDFFAQYATMVGVGGNSESKKASVTKRVAFFVKKIKKFLCRFGFNISASVFKRVAKRLDSKGYDLVVCFQEGITTHFCSYFERTPVVAWVHCDYENYFLNVNTKRNEEHLYEKFRSVVCVSEYTKKNFQKYIHSVKDVYALHNIIDSDLIIKRSKLDINDERFDYDGFKIISIGRIDEVKRFTYIPEIISKMKSRGVSKFRWYIMGDGNPGEKTILNENIRKYGVQDEVVLLGNINNPYPYLANSDLLVSTSRSEACPYVLNEAKILHIPIVATNFGSVYEFLEDGVNGLISPIESIDEKISAMIVDKDLYGRIKENLNSFVYDNSELENMLFSKILTI